MIGIRGGLIIDSVLRTDATLVQWGGTLGVSITRLELSMLQNLLYLPVSLLARCQVICCRKITYNYVYVPGGFFL